MFEYTYNNKSGNSAPPLIQRQKGYCKTTDPNYQPTQTESTDMIFADYEHKDECDTIVERIYWGSATQAEKQTLYDKLSVCTCCWRHLHMRPDKCAKNHKFVPALAHVWDHVECNCPCRHMMRLLASNM